MADHEAAKIDKANHLLLDQPLLRLPYELLRKNFRTAHFVVEKESVAVRNALKDAATVGLRGGGPSSTDDVLKSLDAMVARMRGVKRKLEACAEEEAQIYRQVDARTAHLAELASMQTLDDVAYDAWSRRRFDRLLVDYLLRHGFGASARALVDEDASGQLRALVDTDTFARMAQIRQRLVRDHSVAEALAWCVDNKKELRKMESNLEFMLRFQQFIEMVRSQNLARLADAIAHARRYLTPLHAVYPEECKLAAALMCYPPNEAPADYAAVFGDDRWSELADLFTRTHNQLLSLPAVPLLHLALSSGLSALKTPACHSSSSASVAAAAAAPLSGLLAPTEAGSRPPALNGGGGGAAQPAQNGGSGTGNPAAALSATAANGTSGGHAPPLPPPPFPASGAAGTQVGDSVCPICSTELNALARNVPYAHHSKSHVEHDLMLLPNGQVYGKDRLDEHAFKSGLPPGTIRDLRTGEVFPADKLLKVYIT